MGQHRGGAVHVRDAHGLGRRPVWWRSARGRDHGNEYDHRRREDRAHHLDRRVSAAQPRCGRLSRAFPVERLRRRDARCQRACQADSSDRRAAGNCWRSRASPGDGRQAGHRDRTRHDRHVEVRHRNRQARPELPRHEQDESHCRRDAQSRGPAGPQWRHLGGGGAAVHDVVLRGRHLDPARPLRRSFARPVSLGGVDRGIQGRQREQQRGVHAGHRPDDDDAERIQPVSRNGILVQSEQRARCDIALHTSRRERRADQAGDRCQ